MLSCRFIRIFVFLECLSFLIAKKSGDKLSEYEKTTE